jgi:phage host-nuclease inhibitor protein Gam
MTALEQSPLPAFLEDAPLTDEQIAAEKDAEGEPEQRWRIEGDRQAEWCMRRLAAVEAEGEGIAAQAEEWVRQVEAWKDERLRSPNSDHAFFTAKLCEYMRALREANPKVKSLPLPSGTVSSRTVAPRVNVVDADAVASWARAAGHVEVLKVETSVLVGELKKAATVDGEALVVRDADTGMPVPGLAVLPGGISFAVKVNGG